MRSARHFLSALVFFFFFLELVYPASAGLFQTGANYTVGARPYSSAAGDFNGDGKMDLAVANINGSTVSILLGNGDGAFRAHVDYSAGSGPDSIAVGDLNGDGKLDLAVADNDGDVSVLLGNGDGTFAALEQYPAGTNPSSIAIGDVNGDRTPDLIVANNGGASVSVILGLGDGKFGAPTNYTVARTPISVVLADFNRDGFIDIATANYDGGNISVLLNKGNGTFSSAVNYAAGSSPYQIVGGDLNGDGIVDLAVVNFTDTVNVFPGKGDGTFGNAIVFNTNQSGSDGLGIADFNGDGILDLLTIEYYSDTATLLLGKGDGSFQTPYSYAVGIRPNGVTVADLNGDGAPDVIAADNFTPEAGSAGTITVALGNRDGTLRAGRAYGQWANDQTLCDLVAADFNHDGNLDIVTSASFLTNGVTVFLSNGDTTFKSPVTYSAGQYDCAMATGDFNHDSFLDLAVVDDINHEVNILPGNGDGTFGTDISYSAGPAPGAIVAGDLNQDGNVDLAVTEGAGGSTGYGSFSVLFGNGDGSFQPPSGSYGTSGSDPSGISIADVNRDGLPDIVAAANGFLGYPGANVFLNRGHGFAPEINYQTPGQATGVAIGDLNHDGYPDLLVTDQTTANVSVFLNQGGKTFGKAVNYSAGLSNYSPILTDLNGDGNLDIVFADTGGEVNVLTGKGDGTFKPAALYEPGFPDTLAAGDFNNDGAVDLAAGQDYNLVVIFNTRGTNIGLTSSPNPSKSGQTVTFTATVNASLPGEPAPTGAVTFKDGSITLATVPLSGSTAEYPTSTLATGRHKITATYSGDVNFNRHTSATLTQVVTQ